MADRQETGLTPEQRDELIRIFESKDPSIFRELLADAIGAKPTPEALQTFANKSPDRWAQLLMIEAKLAGAHTDKLEVEGTGFMAFARQVQGMSDAQLEAEYLRRTAPKPAKVIDITPQSGATAQDDDPTASPRAAHP